MPPGLALAQELAPPSVADPPEPESQVSSGRDAFSRITVPVTINGLGPYNFMVDTGANRSCISTSLARKLNLPSAGQVLVNTIVGRKVRDSVLIEKLQVGVRAQRRVKTPVLPFVGTDIEGLLAVDWLQGQRLVLDMARKQVTIARSRTDVSTAESVVVPARKRIGQLTIVDADLGKIPISAMIDSGAQLSIGNPVLRALVDPRLVERIEHVTMVSVTGETFPGELINLPFLRLGGVLLGNVPVVFADISVFGLWGLGSKPALVLGMDLLRTFSAVSMDFGRSTVTFDTV